MGYSATATAFETLHRVEAVCRDTTGSSNTWKNGDRQFFFEIGRERPDGAITGTVNELKGNLAYPAGSFRIEPNGRLTRFPHLPKAARR